MKILVSLNNGPDRGSPNVTGQASSLVRQTLAAPINEAKASISQSVGVAARRLKRWAEEQIEKDPLGSGPEFDLCKKIFLNPAGIATQVANTMVLAQVVQKTKVDVLLDAWERSALSSSAQTSNIDPNLRLLTRKCCTQADYKKAQKLSVKLREQFLNESFNRLLSGNLFKGIDLGEDKQVKIKIDRYNPKSASVRVKGLCFWDRNKRIVWISSRVFNSARPDNVAHVLFNMACRVVANDAYRETSRHGSRWASLVRRAKIDPNSMTFHESRLELDSDADRNLRAKHNQPGIEPGITDRKVLNQAYRPRLLESIASGIEDEISYPSLDEYLARPADRSDYIKSGTFTVYMRRGDRIIKIGPKVRKARALTVANINASGREANSETSLKPNSTGNFKVFMDRVEVEAKQRGYDCVYVESVLNGFLPAVSQRRGYVQRNEDDGTLNYVKFV